MHCKHRLHRFLGFSIFLLFSAQVYSCPKCASLNILQNKFYLVTIELPHYKYHNPNHGCCVVHECFLLSPLQVRCAAVFALGTFVGNSAERTDHSTTIDHNVAMMLAQLINDGSPIVRKASLLKFH